MKKIHVLAFAVRAIPILVNNFGGLLSLIFWSGQEINRRGLRGFIGQALSIASAQSAMREYQYRVWQRYVETPSVKVAQGSYLAIIEDGCFSCQEIEYLKSLSGLKEVLTCQQGSTVDLTNIKTFDFVIIILRPCLLEWSRFETIERALENSEVVYFDHDFINAAKHRISPYFKPEYSFEMLADPAFAPIIIVKPELLLSLGSESLRLASVYNLILACFQTTRVHPKRICEVIAHFTEDLPAREEVIKEYKRIVKPDIDVSSCTSNYPEFYSEPSQGSKLSIIILTKDKVDLLDDCVRSIISSEMSLSYEIIIVDNNSVEEKTHRWFDAVTEMSQTIKVLKGDMEFSWSKLNNLASREAAGDIFVFLNNDTEVISKDWPQRIAGLLVHNGVGVVGGLLLYPDGTIQHAGVVLGYGGVADHVYSKECLEQPDRLFVSPLVRREVSAVTGAFLAVTRKTFQSVGGFDERFRIAGDVAFCLSVSRLGSSIVYDPGIKFTHHESKTRKAGLPDREVTLFQDMLRGHGKSTDPLFHPQISLKSTSPIPRFFKE